jgi:hypothetical protein
MVENQFTFDEQAYLAANPDVAAAIGMPGDSSGYEHYINWGKNEGRNASFNNSLQPNDVINLLHLEGDEAQQLNNLKQTNPNEFYNQSAQKLADAINFKWQTNSTGDRDYPQLEDALNSIEQVAPQAYYPARISSLANHNAWGVAENNLQGNSDVQKQIDALVPKAIASGVDPSALQSNYQSGYQSGYTGGKQQMANAASSGNFWHDNLIGALKVGSLALGAYGLDSALTAGMTGMVDAAGNIVGGGAEGAAYGSSLGTNAALQGPTYGELGVTGVPEGGAGPTYAEMGYTGLNQADAIAAADAASKGLTGADALKYVNQARQVAGTGSQLAKLLGGTTGGTSAGTNAGTNASTSGINPQQLASLLGGGQQTNSFIGQIKANQNPFTFTSAGQTAASPGMYDVSGSNLANALRKA